MYLFCCDFSSCLEPTEISHADSICVKIIPVFCPQRGNEASNTFMKFLPPPPSTVGTALKHTCAVLHIVLKDVNSTLFGDGQRERDG